MSVALERRDPIDLLALPPRELTRAGEKIKRNETIPLASIVTEMAIIDESHADDLGDSMARADGHGQITPIAVRARREDNKVVYDIIDGFHRTHGKKKRGEQFIEATVMYGCSDEELFDLRILAASSVRSVQYPRIVEWITSSFQTTPWAARGLTVVRAFGIAVNNRDTTYGVRLNKEDLEELKGWVEEKCKFWQKSVSTTYQMLRLVANADPDLVHQVRVSGGGKDRIGRITPDRLKSVVTAFPGKEYYAVQRATLGFMVDNRLSAFETMLLVRKIEPLIWPGMGKSSILQVLADVRLDEIQVSKNKIPFDDEKISDETENQVGEPLDGDNQSRGEPAKILASKFASATLYKGPSKQHRLPREGPDAGRRKLDETEEPSDDDLLEIASEAERKLVAGKPVNPSGSVGGSKPLAYTEKPTIQNLQEENFSLKEALRAAHEALKQGGVKAEYWWRTNPHITPFERKILEGLFGEKIVPLDELSIQLKMPTSRIIAYAQSACRRRIIEG